MKIGRRRKESAREEFEEYFSVFLSEVDDPRVLGRCDHALLDILVISFCAILCGAESFPDIERFGEAREEWFRRYLGLRYGIPSHDTFGRVLGIVAPEKLEAAFFEWARQLGEQLKKRTQVCFDGKSLKGTERTFNYKGRRPLHLVNVFCPESGLVLGQKKAGSSGGSEIKAIQACLELLDVKGILLSFDAASSYPVLLKKIREKSAHYLAPIKKNQRKLYPCLETVFEKVPLNGKSKLVDSFFKTSEKNRGRSEKRSCTVIKVKGLDPRTQEQIRRHNSDIASVIRITRYREDKDRQRYRKGDKKGKTYRRLKNFSGKAEVVYYISDLQTNAATALSQARLHWSIENQLHWHLDVDFAEDDCRVKNKKAAQNLSLLRKMAYNALKKEPSRMTLGSKIKKASWDQKYFEKIIFG